MIPIKPRTANSSKGSTILALIFAFIALMGIWSIFSPEATAVPNPTTLESTEQAEATGPDYGEYLLRLGLVTVGLIVVLVVGGRVARRHTTLAKNSDMGIRILGRRYINPKQFFMKVAVDDRLLLVGVSEQSINLITELEISDDEALPMDEAPAQQGFAAFFNRQLQNRSL